jgi:hypothetical protein
MVDQLSPDPRSEDPLLPATVENRTKAGVRSPARWNRSARVNDSFRNTLVVEVKNLLAKMEIFQQGRSARPDLERVLVVRHRTALRRRHHRSTACGELMQFAPFAAVELLVMNGSRFTGGTSTLR